MLKVSPQTSPLSIHFVFPCPPKRPPKCPPNPIFKHFHSLIKEDITQKTACIPFKNRTQTV